MPDDTDTYVNVAIPPAGAPYGPVFEPKARPRRAPAGRSGPSAAATPCGRGTSGRGLLTLDFVVHGDEGVAGPWAAGTAPGDMLVFEGPGSGYRPDPEADWHLMVGDESALPAIAASLEAVPAGRPVVVRLVCDGPEHQLDADLPRRPRPRAGCTAPARPTTSTLLADAVSDLEFPPGRVHAFVHGEAEEIRGVRRHLLTERGLTRADMSCSPYWRRTMTDEAWRSVKRDFVAAMEADVA